MKNTGPLDPLAEEQIRQFPPSLRAPARDFVARSLLRVEQLLLRPANILYIVAEWASVEDQNAAIDRIDAGADKDAVSRSLGIPVSLWNAAPMDIPDPYAVEPEPIEPRELHEPEETYRGGVVLAFPSGGATDLAHRREMEPAIPDFAPDIFVRWFEAARPLLGPYTLTPCNMAILSACALTSITADAPARRFLRDPWTPAQDFRIAAAAASLWFCRTLLEGGGLGLDPSSHWLRTATRDEHQVVPLLSLDAIQLDDAVMQNDFGNDLGAVLRGKRRFFSVRHGASRVGSIEMRCGEVCSTGVDFFGRRGRPPSDEVCYVACRWWGAICATPCASTHFDGVSWRRQLAAGEQVAESIGAPTGYDRAWVETIVGELESLCDFGYLC